MSLTAYHFCGVTVAPFMLLLHVLVHPVNALNSEHKSEEPNFIQCKKDSRKGDIGTIPFWEDESLPKHPKNIMKVHSRQKRFLHFPTGGTLSIKPELTLQKYSDAWHSVAFFIGFPLSVSLPKAKLRLKDFHFSDESYYDEDEILYEENSHVYKRSLDYQRNTGFEIIQHALDNLGLPGRECLLRFICDTADEPLESFGIIGEIFNMFFTPGYGKRSEGRSDFIIAEEKGRNNSCNTFTKCPLHLADFIQNGITFLDSGITSASIFQGLRALSY